MRHEMCRYTSLAVEDKSLNQNEFSETDKIVNWFKLIK